MPLSDYESPDAEFTLVPDGRYTVTIDDATGEIKDGKVKLKVRYRITLGDQQNRCLFKDYYISERTCEKFLPWQFGVMGIWKTVRDADDFEKALQVAIDECGKIMKDNINFTVETEKEAWEYNGKSGERINVVLLDNLGSVVANVADSSSESKFDSSEPIPF